MIWISYFYAKKSMLLPSFFQTWIEQNVPESPILTFLIFKFHMQCAQDSIYSQGPHWWGPCSFPNISGFTNSSPSNLKVMMRALNSTYITPNSRYNVGNVVATATTYRQIALAEGTLKIEVGTYYIPCNSSQQAQRIREELK